MTTSSSAEIRSRHNVQIFGQGAQDILFAHGYGCDQTMWRYLVPAFTDKYRVILYDIIGAGKSDESRFSPHRYDSLGAYAEDILEIARELKLKDAIFVGHSFSAMTGLLAAVKDPSVFSELILIGPSPRYTNIDDYVGGFEADDIEDLLENLASNYLGWSAAMAPVIMGNAERPELGEELTNSFCRMNPEIAKAMARVVFLADNRADLKKVSARALILQCSEDVIAPLVVGQYMHAQIPVSELVIMKATGHCPHLSAPAETIREIHSFLGKRAE